MRIILMLALLLIAFAGLGCDTKKKLDDTLDNANKTITKANMKLDELSQLAHDLKNDLSAAVQMTGMAASKTIADLGDAAGGIPKTGGEVKGTDETVDLDEDGTKDSVKTVEYDDKFLWLVEASTLDAFACKTQLYFVTDKPPEKILGWGLVAEGCGASACSPDELEKDEPDLSTCECQDAEGASIDCAELYATLGGRNGSSGGTDDAGVGSGGMAGSAGGAEECPAGTEGTPPDCTPIGGTEVSALACADGSDSIVFDEVCDGTSDCADDSDERCAAVWLCDSGEAAAPASVCDGTRDCSDGSDEAGCVDTDWTCANGSETVSNAWLCDGAEDCADGSDEQACEPVWLCDDGEDIIVVGGVCDGAKDCGDGSDESRCEGSGGT